MGEVLQLDAKLAYILLAATGTAALGGVGGCICLHIKTHRQDRVIASCEQRMNAYEDEIKKIKSQLANLPAASPSDNELEKKIEPMVEDIVSRKTSEFDEKLNTVGENINKFNNKLQQCDNLEGKNASNITDLCKKFDSLNQTVRQEIPRNIEEIRSQVDALKNRNEREIECLNTGMKCVKYEAKKLKNQLSKVDVEELNTTVQQLQEKLNSFGTSQSNQDGKMLQTLDQDLQALTQRCNQLTGSQNKLIEIQNSVNAYLTKVDETLQTLESRVNDIQDTSESSHNGEILGLRSEIEQIKTSLEQVNAQLGSNAESDVQAKANTPETYETGFNLDNDATILGMKNDIEALEQELVTFERRASEYIAELESTRFEPQNRAYNSFASGEEEYIDKVSELEGEFEKLNQVLSGLVVELGYKLHTDEESGLLTVTPDAENDNPTLRRVIIETFEDLYKMTEYLASRIGCTLDSWQRNRIRDAASEIALPSTISRSPSLQSLS